MTTHAPLDAINRPMNALRYSLASYLRFARPRVDADSRAVADALIGVATGHDLGVTRIGELLVKRHGHAVSQTFPAVFTALNDLSIRYILPLVIENERQIVRTMEAAAVELECDAVAYDLVAELVDRERRHLHTLQQLRGACRANRSFAPVHTTPQAPIWPTAIERRKARVFRERGRSPELVSN